MNKPNKTVNMKLNNGLIIPQIGVGFLRQSLFILLLCGVCFACNAPQQDGKKTDLTSKNMTNGELREKLALALEDMKAKAIEMGIEGVATASVLNNGDTVDWIGEMKVVGSYCNWKDGYNLVAVAWSKCGKVVYQNDDVVFRQLDEQTWIGNGHRVYNESLYLVDLGGREILDGERKPTVSNGNNGGMDMMVDEKGVRINFSSRFGMK